MTAHSPAFRRGLASIARGEILVPPLRAYLMNPDFNDFTITVQGTGERAPDYWFHPSEHPGWNDMSLWTWMIDPTLLLREKLDDASMLAVTVGKIWHDIVEKILLDLGLLTATEVYVEDPETMARGSMDGEVYTGEVFEFKGLALDTPLPTPGGWTTMGDVQVGDSLIGSDGTPCTVTAASGVMSKPCYRITFDDRTSIVCDEDHLWAVSSGQSGRLVDSVISASEIAATASNSQGQSNHRVVNAAPLDLPLVPLEIDPYLIGVWIGDGSRGDGRVTQDVDSNLWGILEDMGHRLGAGYQKPGSRAVTRTIYGLRSRLISMGMLGDKSVPASLLRGHREQRMALLQGLMDTDGGWDHRGKRAVFVTVRQDLAEQVRELIVSLGMRCRVTRYMATGFGISRPAFQVVFTPAFNVFRARAHLMGNAWTPPVRSTRRSISRIEKVDSVPTRCVQVDSIDSTYLCGRQMVPTHNTAKQELVRKITSVEAYIEMYPGYYLQAIEYMRMSGSRAERVVVMALSYPYEMREFVIPYDLGVANQIAEKYKRVLQAVADRRPPMCEGCFRVKGNLCPARAICQHLDQNGELPA